MEWLFTVLIAVLVAIVAILLIPAEIAKFKDRNRYNQQTHANDTLKIVNVFQSENLTDPSLPSEKHSALLKQSYSKYKSEYAKNFRKGRSLVRSAYPVGTRANRALEFQYDAKLKRLTQTRSFETTEAATTPVIQLDQALSLDSGIERILATRRAKVKSDSE
jgi:hypothetical protein